MNKDNNSASISGATGPMFQAANAHTTMVTAMLDRFKVGSIKEENGLIDLTFTLDDGTIVKYSELGEMQAVYGAKSINDLLEALILGALRKLRDNGLGALVDMFADPTVLMNALKK